jgi:non-ribosomal peptide synthetase component F
LAISAYQFRDFAQTRNTFSAQDHYKQQEQHWLSEYQALPKTLKWPPNGASGNAKDFDAASARMDIPPQLLYQIRQHSSESQHSLFTVLLAALSLALRAYGAVDDISIAVPMAGQAASNHPALVGQCTNLVPVRCQMADGMTFSGYTAEIQEKIIGAYENQEYSCAFLTDKFQTQFCSVAFTHTKKLKPEQCDYAALTVDYEFNPVHSQTFDLHFELTEHKDRLVLECSYRKALFAPASVQEIFEDTILMLKKFGESPAAAIDFIDEDRDPVRAAIAT